MNDKARPPAGTTSIPLTQNQIDWITTRTNDRGANFGMAPYFFQQTQLVNRDQWLNIVVQVLATGGLHGGSVKAHAGVLDGSLSDAFKALVEQTLGVVERNVS